MLIRFSTENFLSFKDEVVYSMIPGLSRSHLHHIVKEEGRNKISLLKAGVIYGANASGKSNLIKAMDFSKELIINGTKPNKLIPINCFKLSNECQNNPSKFEFEFKSKGKSYAYGFTLDSKRIYSEWLYLISKRTEKMVFERKSNNNGETIIDFGKVKFKDKDDKQFVKFTALGTRANQLFLTESIERGMKHFEDVFYWFNKVIKIIFPESRYIPLEKITIFDEDKRATFLKLLKSFDTGISDVSLTNINPESIIDVPQPLLDEVMENVEEGKTSILQGPTGRYTFKLEDDDKIHAYKYVTNHKMMGGKEETPFEISDESDGTQRLFDLIPAVIDLIGSEKVYIIDELDRSLHPILCYKFLELFLNNKTEQASQLIVTTHESSLLDLKLLRRDEIWFVEKNLDGASSVYSLEEFTPRYDADVQKGYLLGRFGAIPIVSNTSDLGWE